MNREQEEALEAILNEHQNYMENSGYPPAFFASSKAHASILRQMIDQAKVAIKQPAPRPGKEEVFAWIKRDIKGTVYDELIPFIEERYKMGLKKHGGPLMTFNGRDALMDAFQEDIDSLMYKAQNFMESQTNINFEAMADQMIATSTTLRAIQQRKAEQ